ncbi:MAG: hypothetical protein ACOVQ6_11365, partial [Brevundimonas sp.]
MTTKAAKDAVPTHAKAAAAPKLPIATAMSHLRSLAMAVVHHAAPHRINTTGQMTWAIFVASGA